MFFWWEEGGQGGTDNMGDFLKISFSWFGESFFVSFLKNPKPGNQMGCRVQDGAGISTQVSTVQSGTKVGAQW